MLKKLACLCLIGTLPVVAWADEGDDHHDDGHHHHHHDGDIIIGVDAAGKLAVEYDFDEAIALPPVDGIISGWGGDDPGLFGLEEDETDLFVLSQDARISFEIISIADGLRFWDVGFVEKTAGESALLTTFEADEGIYETHYHPGAWHLDPSQGATPELGDIYTLTFRLTDDGVSGYTASDAYTLTFVPEPTSAMLLALGALIARNRRSL